MLAQDGAPDRELLARFATGDEGALESLLGRHETRLYRIAYSYLRNRDDALDVVQETFVKLCRSAGSLGPNAEVGPWLSRVCANGAIDQWRSRKRRAGREDSLEVMMDSGYEAASRDRGPDGAVAAREASARVAAGLRVLTSTQAQVVMLRHVSGLSLEEIGIALGLKLGTVKSNLHRALLRLKDELAETSTDGRATESSPSSAASAARGVHPN